MCRYLGYYLVRYFAYKPKFIVTYNISQKIWILPVSDVSKSRYKPDCSVRRNTLSHQKKKYSDVQILSVSKLLKSEQDVLLLSSGVFYELL